MARSSIVVALLLAAGLPGCVLPVEHEHCGMTYSSLTWTQTDLAEALTNDTVGATHDPGAGQLPWANPWGNLSGLRLQRIHVRIATPVEHHVGIVSYTDPIVSWMDLEGTGVASSSTEGNVTEQELEQAFRSLAANVSLADEASLAEAARGFARSRQDTGARANIPLDEDYKRWREEPIYTYAAAMPGPLRLEVLLHEDLAIAAPRTFLGGGVAEAGPWTFDFTLPTWSVQHGEARMTVDRLGHASFAGTPTENESAFYEEAHALARMHGLPPLAIDDVPAHGSIC